MEVLAENQFTITKSLYMEGMLRISRDGYGKSARRVMLVILGLWLVFFLYTIAAQGDILHSLGFLVIIGMAGLWLCVGMPRSNAKRLWTALEGKYGSSLQRTTFFYPDHLLILGDGLEKQIFYHEIQQIKQSRRLLILVCEDKTGVLIARDGFTRGTETEVNALLSNAINKE